MRKKIFTLQELYDYLQAQPNRSFQYSAKDEREELKILFDSMIAFKSNDNSDDTEGLLPVELYSCHLGENLNGSFISEKSGKKALPSFKNRPILGYIHDVDGQPEFYGHNMEEGEDGDIIYYEIPVGVIPESNDAKFEDRDGKTYIVVKGYIYEEYSKAAEILEREGECSCSVELSVREFSYNAKDKVIVFDDFYFSGVTILGKDDNGKDVKPGMTGSNIKALHSENGGNALIDILEKLNDTLSRFNDNQTGKEEPNVTLFEELLAQYGKTAEDVTFEYEGLSDDELRKAFEEAFGTLEQPENSPEPESDSELVSEPEPENDSAPEQMEVQPVSDPAPASEPTPVSDTEPVTDTEPTEVINIEFTAKIADKVRTFSISLNDKLNAIYQLVNATYGELDDDFYDVVVFDDTKTVEMHGYFRGKNYRQTYKVRNNEYQLVGDRVEIFCKWMTEDELNQFENMKSNYAALEQFKADKEAEVVREEKMNLLADYAAISETDEYKALVQNIDTFSKDEVVEKADAIVGKLARQGKNFSFNAEAPVAPAKHFFGFNNNNDESKAPSYAKFLD